MPAQFLTLHALATGERLEQARSRLAAELGGTVGAPDKGGMIEIEVDAHSHDEALRRVRDAIGAIGLDEHFTFPAQTGTAYRPPGRRAPAPDEQPSDDEPPHLTRGSPRSDEPEPGDPPRA